MTLAKVENGEITRYNVSEKAARRGLTNFAGDFLSEGFYEIVGDAPSYSPDSQTMSGPTYAIVGNEVVRSWVVSDKSLATVKSELLEKIESNRYAAEVAGLTIEGMPVSTDRESRGMIREMFANKTSGATFNFKTSDGNWVTLTQSQLTALAKRVQDHTQEMFTEERAAYDAIMATTSVVDALAVDTTIGS